MALCKTIEDREFSKFVEDSSGDHAVRVVVSDAADTNGLVQVKKIQHAEVSITSTGWTELTTTAVDRIGINVQNNTNREMAILFGTVVPVVGYVGMKIRAGGERQYAESLADSYKAWGRLKSGSAQSVDVEELRE